MLGGAQRALMLQLSVGRLPMARMASALRLLVAKQQRRRSSRSRPLPPEAAQNFGQCFRALGTPR